MKYYAWIDGGKVQEFDSYSDAYTWVSNTYVKEGYYPAGNVLVMRNAIELIGFPNGRYILEVPA